MNIGSEDKVLGAWGIQKQLEVVARVSTEVLFFTSGGIRNFLKNVRNSAEFRGIPRYFFSKIYPEFRVYLFTEFRR